MYIPCHFVPVGIQGVPGVTVGFQQQFKVFRVSLWGSDGNLGYTQCHCRFSLGI